MAADMREDVESWDVNVVRRWPYFRLSGRPEDSIIPPVEVQISVRFITEDSAMNFEANVRELLQP